MTSRIFFKLIGFSLLLLLMAMACAHLVANRVLESHYVLNLREELEERAKFLAQNSESKMLESPAELMAMAGATGARVTIIDRQGVVLAETSANRAQMENHAKRPEFAEALQGRVGWIKRPSPTIGEEFLYVAAPSPAGALRLAVPVDHIRDRVDASRRQIISAIALSFLPAVLIAAIFARNVSSRMGRIIKFAAELSQGNFHARLSQMNRGELGILSDRLNETGEKLRQIFEELQREHAELEKAERTRKDFIINVSHELRTPLAAIQGYAETLASGAVDDPAHNRKFLNIILQNSERLTRLTSDLLTLSGIEMRQRRFQIGSYYLNRLLSEEIESIRPAADKRRLTVTFDPAAGDPEIRCDSSALHQILSNLLDNAVKYTPEGGEIHLRARLIPGAGEHDAQYEISVGDTGIGIPEEHLPRLFERFYRVDRGRSRELGGTGLGLAIVKHLVRSHGGDIYVESEVNRGSTFRFTLPKYQERHDGMEELHSELTLP